MSAVDAVLKTHAEALEEVYILRTAGDHTFQGLLIEFYLDMAKVGAVPSEFPTTLAAMLNFHAGRISTAYTNQTYGDSGFIGSLVEFALSVNADLGVTV